MLPFWYMIYAKTFMKKSNLTQKYPFIIMPEDLIFSSENQHFYLYFLFGLTFIFIIKASL